MDLTKREKEIVSYFVLGKTHKEIANILFLSEETVRSHRKRIYKRIGAHNVADLVRMYVSDMVNIDVKKLIKENLLEPNVKKVSVMFICLALQAIVMYESLDARKTSTRTKLVKSGVKAKKAKRNKSKDYLLIA